jgi:hypothetical protein
MLIRCPMIGQGTPSDPLSVDLPTYTVVTSDATVRRAFVDVPAVDIPSDVAAFVAANPVSDLTSPLPNAFPASLARSWQEHLARQYNLGTAKWKPVVA